MKKFDYYYALGVGKFLNGTEWLVKAFFPSNYKEVDKQLNLRYGKAKNQRLDIFYAAGSENVKKPIFFYIHGGGFVSGKTALRRNYCCKMAREGFFVVNIDYRTAPKVQFKDSFYDIFNAIDYVLSKSDKYNLDAQKIVVGGESAGAYFSAYIAAMTKQKELYDNFNIDFQRKNDFEVKSLVLINGAYDIANTLKAKAPFTKTFMKAFANLQSAELKDISIIQRREFSPLSYVTNDFPKAVVVQGEHDVFGHGTQLLLKVFDEVGVDYSLIVAKGIAGCHAACIIPISKEAVRVQNETAKLLKQNLEE